LQSSNHITKDSTEISTQLNMKEVAEIITKHLKAEENHWPSSKFSTEVSNFFLSSISSFFIGLLLSASLIF